MPVPLTAMPTEILAISPAVKPESVSATALVRAVELLNVETIFATVAFAGMPNPLTAVPTVMPARLGIVIEFVLFVVPGKVN